MSSQDKSSSEHFEHDALKKAVISAIAEVLEVAVEEVRPDSLFTSDLGANSLDVVNLIWYIEEKFNLAEVSESELENLESVQELINLVKNKSEESGVVQKEQKVAFCIASDHAGVELKAVLISFLKDRNIHVIDLGPNNTHSVDYPDYAKALAQRVAKGKADYGILICGTGVGMSIAANKVHGIRAALCSDPVSAKLTRLHNNANVLCLGARIIGSELALACVDAFLSTDFDPGDDQRHQRRIDLISDIEHHTHLNKK